MRLVADEEFDNNGLDDGRVEVCLDGRYGAVCDDFWDSRDAAVLCRQWGRSPHGVLWVNSYVCSTYTVFMI